MRTDKTPLQQAEEATSIAREAFGYGDLVTGIAAITLAAQLVQLARLTAQTMPKPGDRVRQKLAGYGQICPDRPSKAENET